MSKQEKQKNNLIKGEVKMNPFQKTFNQIGRKIKGDQEKILKQLNEGRKDKENDTMIKMKFVIDNLEKLQANEE